MAVLQKPKNPRLCSYKPKKMALARVDESEVSVISSEDDIMMTQRVELRAAGNRAGPPPVMRAQCAPRRACQAPRLARVARRVRHPRRLRSGPGMRSISLIPRMQSKSPLSYSHAI